MSSRTGAAIWTTRRSSSISISLGRAGATTTWVTCSLSHGCCSPSFSSSPWCSSAPASAGCTKEALVDPRREDSTFVDPAHPELGTIEWQGRWRTLEQSWKFDLRLDNFVTVWQQINFGRLLLNTFAIALLGTIGTLLSSIVVAYGF